MDTPRFPEVHVRLSGEDGNAFFIIGRTLGALRSGGVSKKQIEEFEAEAISGNYDNVLQTVMAWVTTS